MAHSITAIILKGLYNIEKAKSFDLLPVNIYNDLTLFHIDHYYSGYWNYKLNLKGVLKTYNVSSVIFPNEISLAEILKIISYENENVLFAIIQTDYFGGQGEQYANIFRYKNNISSEIKSINQALNYLGVKRTENNDEFEIVGLDEIRSNPEYLEKYYELIQEYE